MTTTGDKPETKQKPPTRQKASAKSKQALPKVSSELLARQTAEFLKGGGTIEVVKPGVSGREYPPGRKHITLDSKSR